MVLLNLMSSLVLLVLVLAPSAESLAGWRIVGVSVNPSYLPGAMHLGETAPTGRPTDLFIFVRGDLGADPRRAPDSAAFCWYRIDFGDGEVSAGQAATGVVGRSAVRKVYTKPGLYEVRVVGEESWRGCDGGAKVSLQVLDLPSSAATPPGQPPPTSPAGTPPGQPAPTSPGATPPGQGAAGSPAAGILRQPGPLESQATRALNPCPSGWSLVPGSSVGNAFSCGRNPLLSCPPNTRYFDDGRMIGCR